MTVPESFAFDLETLNTKSDKIGWPEYKQIAGVSVLCTVDLETMAPAFFTTGDINDFGLETIARGISMAKEIVSYNGRDFDIPVLEAAIERTIPVMCHVDLWQCIREATRDMRGRYGKGDWTLDRVCKGTLRSRKLLNDGVYAPLKWREGRIGEVTTYCWKDSWLTAQLYQFIQKYGYVVDPHGRTIQVDLFPC